MKRCKSCYHFFPYIDSEKHQYEYAGVCRHSPPTPILYKNENGFYKFAREFPPVNEGDGCGQHEQDKSKERV